MKPRGLSKDFKLQEQSPETYPFGKNGILTGNTRAIQNEHGFRLSSAVIPYRCIGVVETDTMPIIFSTDNLNSAIGFYDEITDTYIPIVDDKNLEYKLTFNLNYPIKGEAHRNYLNHIEVAFFDTLNPVRLIDTIKPPTTLRGYLLFPEFITPQISLEAIEGGNVEVGANYAAIRYIKNDGTETRYVTASSPVFTTVKEFNNLPGSSSGKSLKVYLTGLDTSYDYVQVAILRKNKGIITVIALDKVPISEAVTVYYNGTEGTDITLEEVLIPSAFYKNVGAMTQLGDVLFLGDIQENKVINMQKYANLIRLKCRSLFVEDIASDERIKSGQLKTFKHGEVIAAYIVYTLSNGQKTDAFHIPGIAPENTHLEVDPIAANQQVSAKKYQTNTLGVKNIDKTNRTSSLGVWINSDETYPNLPDLWNSSEIGGENLIGLNVRHHKIPTLQQMVEWYYTDVKEYGVTGLDVIGIMPENVIIPNEYRDIIIGYEIFYAKRDYNNCTIPASGLTIQATKSKRTGDDWFFTGGNWHASVLRSDGVSSDDSRMLRLQTNADISKIHHPDLMINKPVINPSLHISNFKVQANIGSKGVVDNTYEETNLKVDYLLEGKRVEAPYLIKGVEKAYYMANNAIRDNIKNLKSEDGYVTKYKVTGFPVVAFEKAVQARETAGDPWIPDYEQAQNIDLLIIRNNMYLNFGEKELVRTNLVYSAAIEPSEFSYSGDCFLVVHSYFSHGLVNSLDRFAVNPGVGTDGIVDGNWIHGGDTDTYTDEFFLGTAQGKYARRYITESVHNEWLRYEDPAIKTSKFWPASTTEILHGMDRNKDNNTIAISQEATSVGDMLNGIKAFSVDTPKVEYSPYKIVRSDKQVREARLNSWKNYNPLDYYEADKNMGKIVNLQGMGDKLIIHHQNALYLTREITTMKTDVLSVTLGSGDIFRIAPIQGRPSKNGYGGTRHKLACVLTDYGYIFPDSEVGVLYVLNEEGLNPINNEINNFLTSYLTTKGVNPFIGNGITIGYDREFKRLLVTLKNIQFENYVPDYEETPEFFNKLIPGVSIVLREGRYQLYKGNNTTQYSCQVFTNPVLPDYVQTIPEFTNNNYLVGTVSATGGTPGYTYYIMSGNTNNAFSINALTGKLTVNNYLQLDRALQTQFILGIKVIDSKKNSDVGTFTINLTHVNLPPSTKDYVLEVDEHTANNTALQQVVAQDPRNLNLTFTIESQSVAGAVKINSTGLISVNDSSKFIIANPVIDVIVKVTNSVGLYVFSHIRLFMVRINNPPTGYNKEVTILDTHIGIVMTYDKPTDPDEAFQTLAVTVESMSQKNAFIVDTDKRTVKVNPDYKLDPEYSPYTINMKVNDSGTPQLEDTFILTVNVLYDPETLQEVIDSYVCDDHIVIPNFDYLVLNYSYTTDNGDNLNSITGFKEIPVLPSINNLFVGEGYTNILPAGITTPLTSAYLYYTGENPTLRSESVLINFKKLLEANVTLPNILKLDMYCFWRTAVKKGNAVCKIVAYKGGTMFTNGKEFENPLGEEVFNQTVIKNVPLSSTPIINTFTLISTIEYNKNTLEAYVIFP